MELFPLEIRGILTKKQLTGRAVHSQLCYQGQVDEPCHLSGTGGKILGWVQQHGEQHQQAFSVVTEAYEKWVHQGVQYNQCYHPVYQTIKQTDWFYQILE